MLTTKVQKDNQIKSINLKATNQVLEASKKEYQKHFLEHETLKRKFTEQHRELLECQNHIKNQIKTNTKKQDRKMNLEDIKLDANELKNIFNARKKRGAILIIILTMMTIQLMTNVARVLMR